MKLYLSTLWGLLIALSIGAQTPNLIIPVGHTEAITVLATFPDGEHIVSGSADKQLKIWKTDGRLVRTMTGHLSPIKELAVSPDGKFMASASDTELILWNNYGDLLLRHAGENTGYGNSTSKDFHPQWTPDGKFLVFQGSLSVEMLDPITRKITSSGSGAFSDKCWAAANGSTLYQKSLSGIVAFSAETGRILRQFPLENIEDPLSFTDVFPHPGGSLLYLAYPNGNIYVLRLQDGSVEQIRKAELDVQPVMMLYSAMMFQVSWARWTVAPNDQLVCWSNQHSTELYAVTDTGLELVRESPIAKNFPYKTAYSQDSTGGFAHPLAFSPDSRYLLWRTEVNEEAFLHDLDRGRVVREFTSLGAPYNYYGPNNEIPFATPSSAISTDGTRLFLGTNSGTIKTFNIAENTEGAFQPKAFKQVEWIETDTSGDLSFEVWLNNGKMDALLARQQDSISRNLLDWRDLRDTTTELAVATMNLTNALYKTVGTRNVPYTTQEGLLLPETKRNVDTSATGVQVLAVEDPNVEAARNSPNPGLYFDDYAGVVFLSGKYELSFSRTQSVTDVALNEAGDKLLISNTDGTIGYWRTDCLADSLTPYQQALGMDTTYDGEVIPEFLDISEHSYEMEAASAAKNCLITSFSTSNQAFIHAISQDDGTGLLSCGPVLYRANLNDGSIDELRGHRLDVIGAKFFNDDRFIVSWAKDRSVIVWNARGMSPLFTLFFLNDVDWIATTPSGLFDASPAAMNALSYSVGLELLDVGQLKERYYEPGLVPKMLGLANEGVRPVEGFDQVDLFPAVAISIDTATLNIRLTERSGGVGKTSVFINGKEIIEDATPLPQARDSQRPTTVSIPLKTFERYFMRHPDSTNTVSVISHNAAGWLKSKPVSLSYRPPLSRGGSRMSLRSGTSSFVGQFNSKMYAIIVGTRDYRGEQLDLSYPDKDALAMAIAVRETGGALFNDPDSPVPGDSIEVFCLSTSPQDSIELRERDVSWTLSTKKNIESTFREIGRRAKAEDVILVYFSGHGIAYGSADQSQFYYLTRDIANGNLSDNTIREQFAISTNEITDWLNTIPALKQVLIIDACNSGTVIDQVVTGGAKDLNSDQLRALERMKDRTGMFIISGSASDKESYEDSKYGQGLLTYALLKGIISSGANRKYIDVMTLLQYAVDEVPILASTISENQTPRLGMPANAASFDIGIADGNLNIPLSKPKPIMIRSTFLNDSTYRDDLRLASLLEEKFREESEKGFKADLIYVNTSVYPGAYSVSGIYKVKEGKIHLSARLFRDEVLIKSFDLPPKSKASTVVSTLKYQLQGALKD